jgi:hypothetical protein
MKDLGPLHHFLSITVERHPDGLFLHQRTYTLDILKRVVMADCKPCTTPVVLLRTPLSSRAFSDLSSA